MKTAIVLLSGGLDSATVVAMALDQGYQVHALTVSYGQRHIAEIVAARRLAQHWGLRQQELHVDLDAVGGSALTDRGIAVPEQPVAGIPVTYVPARNTLFLSLALGVAEVQGAADLFIGVNAVDYSGYPDCRPEFIRAFEQLARIATKAGVEGQAFRIHAPLLYLGKHEIIREGVRLNVPYHLTVSCYQADGEGQACGRCDSCRIRSAGFQAAGVADPTRYQP